MPKNLQNSKIRCIFTSIKHTTMKNIEIITAREIELENLLKEAIDALLGAKGSFMAFEQTEIGKEDIKEVSKDQIEVLNSVLARIKIF